MLSELYIENLAVIEKATIDFSDKLNVFTGETGAGKSILINGINAILGQRVTKDIVRTGTDKAVISALFTDIGDNVLQVLDELGISAEDGQLFLTREIRSDGGSVARVNSRAVNVSVLKDIGETLVTIHGQHDNQILMAPERHIEILDSYAESEALIEDYHSSFRELQSIAKKINKIKTEQSKKEFRMAELADIVEEINALNIHEGEDKEIEAELNISKNAVAISEALYMAKQLLSGDDDTDGAVEMTQRASKSVEEYTDIMTEISPIYDRLSSAAIEMEDISEEIGSLLDSLDIDPKRYDYLNQRSDELRRIMKKYGPELDDVLTTLENSQNELDELSGAEQSLDELNKEKERLLAEVSKKAKALSDHRKKAGERFVSQVTEELEFLNMPKVKLVVQQKTGKLTINGMDSIEFLISANLGEEPKPIAKIASGGELSRIMLALKNVIAEKDSIGTLIFDEIDTGVSGRAAQKIGIKLKQISRLRQVLCVTHLAQMAVMADNHLLIEKNIQGDRTVTTVRTLDHEQRKYEIARIMGGENITELMLENAEQYLKDADNM
ncbi:DNA repair protein RecN [Ruminococcus sp. AM43-6]|jgi:DNA repair protein RecN (Recombination protein N)|uniref:DNA repair protein RecN n=1 Tax=Ruminococcus sp. AM43-6 TaxID=2293216 RepID=UPI000E51020B|nr:DNA repair protein RecN [Ruminococcus sp. AM43-6]RGH35660.1 DNA repair protein RecN [Ruminococcus sp. AM43-6]UYJ31408.1 MAG: DNA repair protein RecN [Oscillospiraceae bacterium]